MTVQSWEEMTRARLIKSVAHVVKGLRQVADEVEVEAARNIQRVSENPIEGEDYAYVAEQVIRSVTWGNANLNMSNVVDAAADATAAREEKKRAAPDKPVVDALDELAHVATLWAEQGAALAGRRDPKPANRQTFVLADIICMISNARQIVASKQGEK